MSLGGACLSACVAGCDSRWGEAKRAQTQAAAQSTPAPITASSESAPGRPEMRELHVRLRPNPHYLSQTIDVPKQTHDLIDDTNGVLGLALGVRLVIDTIEAWSFGDDERLARPLAALQADDDGHGVGLVIGLVGALPRPTDSLHEVGEATLLGKYIVVRATGRLEEDLAIDKTFDELSEDDRAALIRRRKRHRALAVFLHELGHTLGALHEDASTSLMNPAYATSRSTFGEGAIALMRASLARTDRVEVARARLAILKDTNEASWVPAERTREIAALRAFLDGSDRARAAGSVAGQSERAPAKDDASSLTGDDAQQFQRARAMLQGGGVRLAYETGRPIFAKYPNDVAVQDLRCQLATLRFLERRELVAECAEYVRLTADAGAR